MEISGARLAANFRAIQSVAGPSAEVLAVVKADAYGHGAALCAPLLREAGAHWLGVTDVEEGMAVRAALREDRSHAFTRILVMCGSEPQDAAALVAHHLTPVVWTLEHIGAMEEAAQKAGRRIRVHLEIDTGMARQGVAPGSDLEAIVLRIATSPWIFCEGLMTHLCCAEVAGAPTTVKAERRFQDAISLLEQAGIRPEFLHIENTSAVDEGGPANFLSQRKRGHAARTMVRTGLALYGHCLETRHSADRLPGWPSEGGDLLRPHLQPVLTWKAPVIGVREVAAGATVGYGATFVAKRSMRLALLPVGYADGFRRESSSGLGDGWVMLNDRKAPVIGRVSMNLTVVDITPIEGVSTGTEAVLLGEGVSAEDHAAWAATIPYDILCGVRGRRVVR